MTYAEPILHGTKHLNPKQIKFCLEYIQNGNNSFEAYKKVYGDGKASEHSMKRSCSKLVRHPAVIHYLEYHRKQILENNKPTVDKLIEECSKIAFSNANDIVEVVDGRFRLKDNADVNILDGGGSSRSENNSETGAGSSESVTWKRSDRLKAMEILAKILGYYDRRTTPTDYNDTSHRVLQAVKQLCDKSEVE